MSPALPAPDSAALSAPLRPMPRIRRRLRTDTASRGRAAREAADRQLAVLVVAAAGSGWIVGPPVGWLVAVLVGLAALVGASAIVAQSVPLRPGGRAGAERPPRARDAARFIPGLIPATLAAAGTIALHALPPRLDLLAGMAGLGVLLAWSVGLERRLALARTVASDEDVAIVLGLSLVAAFVAFVGTGTFVPDGLASSGGATMPLTDLAVLVAADALAAGALGLRMARLRAAGRRNALLGGVSSAAIVGVVAGALRALAIPFLLGPALLTLVFFLWDVLTGSTVARRRSPRWLWEVALLAILGGAVVLLNLRVR
jgi:hypothetical protein